MEFRDEIAALETEVTLLRAALLPFAHRALTRAGQDQNVPDITQVTVTMGECRGAQRALAA